MEAIEKRKMGDDVVIYVIWIDGRKLLAECVYFYLGGAGVSWHRNKKKKKKRKMRGRFSSFLCLTLAPTLKSPFLLLLLYVLPVYDFGGTLPIG